MNTSRIERVVAAVLRADAEDAMNNADTNTGLQHVMDEADRDERRRRIRWASGGLLVAAAAVVAAVIVWWPGANEANVSPVGSGEEQSAAQQLATDFVEAYAAHDRDLVASYLADDADVSYLGGPQTVEFLLLNTRWEQAVSFQWTLEKCAGSSRDADGVLVECPASFHVLHSEELGRGPFGDSQLNLVIRDGKVVSVAVEVPHDSNGLDDEMLLPFERWMEAAHPVQAVILDDWADPLKSEALVDRSLREWELRAREYADAVLAGEAE